MLLPDFAEHEIAYLAEAINCDAQGFKAEPKYVNRIVAADMEPVRSCGGFRVLPDYSFETMPEEYAALVLIGGFGWKTSLAEQVVPVVRMLWLTAGLSEEYATGLHFLRPTDF